MEIRDPAGLEDYRRAVDCHDRAWRVGYRGIVDEEVIEAVRRPTDEDALESFRQEVRAEPGPFLLAEREERVVGYVRARYTGTSQFVGSMRGELVGLYVDPAHWREGVGSALFERSLEWLPPMIDGLDARVLAANDRGRSFLEAHDLTHEETATATVGCASLEHAIYRVRFEDDADDAEAGDVTTPADDILPDTGAPGE